MIRLLFSVIFLPFRLVRWLARRLYLQFIGYRAVHLRVDGALWDHRGPANLWAALARDERGPALLDLLVALDRARRDPRVETILIELGPLRCGLARAEELCDALRAARAAGKRVVVYLESAGLAEYRAAVGASEIVLAPAGAINVTGMATEVVFLKGLLDKVGVRAWLAARGRYKTARELFTEPGMTDANREMTESLVSDLYEQLIAVVAEGRGLAEEVVRARLDEGPFLADAAKNAGLVDAVGYVDELEEQLQEQFGKRRVLTLSRYLGWSTHLLGRGRPVSVGLLEVSGHIKSGRTVPGADGPRATGSRSFCRQAERFARDPSVRAVVLRVDSPGGSALASEVMWRALCRLAEKKPLVVSMASTAASGGYFVSGVRGASVYASGATLTGSIGVLGGKFDTRGVYDWLGVKKEIVRRGRRAAYWSDYTAMSDDEMRKLTSDIDAHYRDFVQKMAEGRGRTFEELDAVAQGRVWTGRQAVDNGLVDARGGLLKALDRVRETLELDERAPLTVVTATERRGLPLRLSWRARDELEALEHALFGRLGEFFAGERLFALLPFDIRFL